MCYICSMKKYYLYTHFRLDISKIFYIGIGTKNKNDLKYGYYTRAFNKTKRNSYWKSIVKLNPNYEINIILESDNYEEIKNKEIELIKFYGRKDLNLGYLANMTNGGDGQVNRIVLDKTKQLISKGNKNKVRSEEFKKKMSLRLIGNKSHLGRIFSEEHRNNISKASKGRLAWNKDMQLSEEHINSIKLGIQLNKKYCKDCNMYFDSANYTKWHGNNCLIGSIKEYIPEIKKLYKEGYNLYEIARMLNIKYRPLYKLKENNLL